MQIGCRYFRIIYHDSTLRLRFVISPSLLITKWEDALLLSLEIEQAANADHYPRAAGPILGKGSTKTTKSHVVDSALLRVSRVKTLIMGLGWDVYALIKSRNAFER